MARKRRGAGRKGEEEAKRRIQVVARAGPRHLNLSGLGLETLPAEIGQLTALKRLDLDSNQLTSLPAEIGQLTALQALYLHENRLTSLPAEIGQLTALKRLSLQGNQVTSLPGEIGQLTALISLDLARNKLTSLPAEIGQLTALIALDLARNKLTSLPAEIGQLIALTALALDQDQLTSLPPEIGQLTALTDMYLHHNQLTSLPPEIGQLTALTDIYLHYNQLTSLPPEVAELEKLETIHLDGNPLPEPLMNAYRRGIDDLKAYLRSLKEGEPLYEAKMLLVGEGEVGKTCLLKAIHGEAFVEKRPTTHGIEISKLIIPHPKLEDKTITLNAWDFGGQPVYRVTHQFFYSRRSLYLLLWSPRMSVDQCDVEGWIRRIKLRVGPDARIIIVATHCASEGRIARIDEAQLMRDYGNVIVGFHEVDSGVNVDSKNDDPAADKIGVKELKRKIAEVAAELPQMGELFSTRWKAARDEVLALGGEPANKPRIPYKSYVEICSKRELDAGATKTLAGLMHDLGHVLYYDDDETLKDDMVLQPEWLTKAIGFVLEDKETNREFGELAHNRLNGIWYDHGVEGREQYEQGLHAFFLRLMERYDVSYRLEGEEASLVAQLVPPVRPKLEWEAEHAPPKGKGQVSLVCQMDAEPPGIIPWMIVRTHYFATDPRRHWQRGMFLKYDGHGEALLELRKGGREFIATVRAAWPNYFMDILHDTLDRLIRDRWPGLEKTYSVPCPGHVNGDPCDGRFGLDALREFMGDGDVTIRCQRCREKQAIGKMLVGFAPRDFDIREQLTRIERGVEGLESRIASGIMILLRAIAGETRECPRMFTLLPEKLTRFNPANIGKEASRLTLWCEYHGEQHPTCAIGSGEKDNNQGERGEYIWTASKDWLVQVAPYARLAACVLKAVVPIAGAATKALVDTSLLTDVTPKLDLMEKVTAGLLRGDFDARSGPERPGRLITEAEGAGLRALHHLLLERDPAKKWGGLRRVVTPTGDYLWLCPIHYRKYEPGMPKL